MQSDMKVKIFPFIILFSVLLSCKDGNHSSSQEEAPPDFQNQGHQLVHQMVQKVGDYDALLNHKDVTYTYTYQTPDGKADVSTEKYLFDGELSYGAYHQHERTFPDLDGTFEQGYDGKEYWLRHNGEILTDTDRLDRVAFNRPTNFYWFTMMQKLLDPGLNYEHLGVKTIDDQAYDIVKVTFNSKDTTPTDIYQLYINRNTRLVDQFLFTVADFGKMETPSLMKVEYEAIDGILLPTKRKYKQSTWNADVSDEPWVTVNWTDVEFDTGLTVEDFKKGK